MSAAQERLMSALGASPDTPATTVSLAYKVDGRISTVQKTLETLCRSSLVDRPEDGRWLLTKKGRKRLHLSD